MANYKNFMPRFGFAYDVFGNGKTSLRGGGGLFYDTRMNDLFNNGWIGSTPFVESYSSSNTTATRSDGHVQQSVWEATNPFPAPAQTSFEYAVQSAHVRHHFRSIGDLPGSSSLRLEPGCRAPDNAGS